MDIRPPAIAALVDHLEARSLRRAARQQVTRWAAIQPALGGCPTPAAVAVAIRTAPPADQDALVCALLRVGADDELAQLTVVAGLSRRLGWIVAGWRRAGVAGPDLTGLKADLVSECWAAVAELARALAGGDDPPPRPAMAVVQRAWHRVRTPRRRQLRHDGRRRDIDSQTPSPAPTVPVAEELADVIVTAVRARRVSVTGARLVFATRVAGWTVEETAGHLGCSPQSVRTRRARTEHRLVAA